MLTSKLIKEYTKDNTLSIPTNIPIKYVCLDLFSPNITNLSIVNNQVELLEGKSDSLIRIYLYENELTSFNLESAPNVKILDLNNNQISTLTGKTKCENLYLCNNKLTSLDTNILGDNIKKLYIYNNPLEKIKNIIPSSIEKLILTKTNLKEITLHNENNLQSLFVDDLQIKEIKNEIKGLGHISKLRILHVENETIAGNENIINHLLEKKLIKKSNTISNISTSSIYKVTKEIYYSEDNKKIKTIKHYEYLTN